MKLYSILKTRFGSDSAIGRAFPRKGKPRTPQAVGKWKIRGVPEDVAILSHLDASIPYEHPGMSPVAPYNTGNPPDISPAPDPANESARAWSVHQGGYA